MNSIIKFTNETLNTVSKATTKKDLAPEFPSSGRPLSLRSDTSEASGGRKFSQGVQIIYSRRCRRITLQRVICSRIAYNLEVSWEEILVLYDNFLGLQTLAQRDEGFRAKFGNSLEELAKLLKSVQINERTVWKLKDTLRKNIKELKPFLLPKRNLSQTELHMKNKVKIRETRLPGVLRKKLPPERYIGVGYRDKGSRRDEAWDGSPSWQDVASRKSYKELLDED